MTEISSLILGVDLGVRSVGLALVNPATHQIPLTAVRVFPAGVDGDFESGRDESRNRNRREKRLARRQTERRRRRLKKIHGILVRVGLLPPGDVHDTLRELDACLAKTYGPHPGPPYILRARALDHRLERHELGRALYHLAQRRGFLSNRRAPSKKDEEEGAVKEGINSLAAAIAASGKRTLGEYFASLDPSASKVRRQYTSRRMYEEEFKAICTKQGEFHTELSNGLGDALHQAVFCQRPLKDQSHLIGSCSLLPWEKRAPVRTLLFQRFRILDRVNALRLADSDRPLTAEQRAIVVGHLSKVAKATYAHIRTKLLGLPKNSRFTIEAGGEKNLTGNSTSAQFEEALNLRWYQLSPEQQDQLVEDWGEAPTDDEFRAILHSRGDFTEEEIARLCEVRLSDDYASLSLTAIRRLVPHLETGMTTGEARKLEFPEIFKAKPPVAVLPPVLETFPDLRNPAVTRVLTEFRKSVNALIRKYGKPDEIHIELARDLKRGKKDREEWTKRTRENEKRRAEAREDLQKHGLTVPSRADIDKYLLWQECNRTCPYSGDMISFDGLFGHHPQFDIEHILPESRSFDNSLANRTLCRRDYNARKSNMIPWEAFGETEEWDGMVARVKNFASRKKFRLFTGTETDAEKILGEFTTSELNDTRHASRLAAQYAGLLYGGVNDANGRKRVFCSAGQVTAQLRRLWKLDSILNPGDWTKSREDHRHHAVDAATVACVNSALIRTLSIENARAVEAGQRRLASLANPWPEFRDHLAEAILTRTNVSLRPERKLRGALHEETLYGVRKSAKGQLEVHVRKPVEKAAKNPGRIVDPVVRAQVQKGLAEGKSEFLMPSGVPIRSVRVVESATVKPIASGRRARNVISGDNHHMEVVAVLKGGKPSYSGYVVSRLDAVTRKRNGQPVVKKDHGPDIELLFTLSEGDMVTWKDQLWRVRGVAAESKGRLLLSRATDARQKDEIIRSGALERPSANVLYSTGGRKVQVSPLGEIREARD
jgi:CRISPR-associated endonuclease Csn1